jgi:hypothetical protein
MKFGGRASQRPCEDIPENAASGNETLLIFREAKPCGAVELVR